MVRDVLGSLLLLGGALWLWLGLVQAQRRQLRLLEELAAFPQGEHDDQVDAASQALRWIYQPALRERAQREAASQLRGADSMFNLG